MIEIFHQVSHECSRITTKQYSHSFSSAIRLLHRDLQKPIYNIYGFVRFADEIVDTFHDYDKHALLDQFRKETFEALDRGISLNPILHSFQQTVNAFGIDHSLITAFFTSMEMDLEEKRYDTNAYEEYIYGSAEVVGLMCLYVFCEGNERLYGKLKPAARSLGAAFQKVNFLRDVKADFNTLNRTYFPGVDFHNFNEEMKLSIEEDIASDFRYAFEGIQELPWKARFGVYVAYKYYLSLFRKIRNVQPSKILEERIRIPGFIKAIILLKAGVKNQLKLI
ncbi:MAG TPA: phytoene/squalene synthase family protein [Flavitalea sp.]|nr:phytoene/squalene synthase family protein [Flavitalea sp.]